MLSERVQLLCNAYKETKHRVAFIKRSIIYDT